MKAQTDQNQTSDSPKPSPRLNTSAPYETVLIKAFDKLTSQVFIFLLAYLILVIGLAVFARQLVTEVRTLLYALPLLGISAYLWQQHRSLANQAKHHGVDVKAGIVAGEAHVTGVQSGAGNTDLPKDVSVGVGMALGKSQVTGFESAHEEAEILTSDSQYLLETFQQLTPTKRRKLITSAQKLMDEP